jgi:hypothetical protein
MTYAECLRSLHWIERCLEDPVASKGKKTVLKAAYRRYARELAKLGRTGDA